MATKLVAIFRDSSREYTCLAVIHRVVEGPAAALVAGTKIKARRIVNLAAEQIHREKHA